MLGRANYVYNPLSIFMLILQAKCSLLCYIVYSIPIWFNICLEDDTGRYTHTWWYPTQHTHMFNCALCSTQRGTLAEKFQVLKGQCHDISYQFEQAKTILRNFTQTWSVIILLEQNLYLNIVRKFQYHNLQSSIFRKKKKFAKLFILVHYGVEILVTLSLFKIDRGTVSRHLQIFF